MTPKTLLMSVGLDEHQALLLTTAFEPDPESNLDNNQQLWSWVNYCVNNVRAMVLIHAVMNGEFLVRQDSDGGFQFQPCNRRRLS